MNRPVSQNPQEAVRFLNQENDALDLVSLLDLLLQNRWLISAIVLFVVCIGAGYAFIATPIYESNILVQVEDSASSSNNLLGELSSVFDMKSAATAEMEILRSRFVLTRAVKNARLNILVEPRYFPFFGRWISRRNNQLSAPGVMGRGGFVWGNEHAEITDFHWSGPLDDDRFVLTATGNGGFRLSQQNAGIEILGRVGEVVKRRIGRSEIELHVAVLNARAGAEFTVRELPVLDTVEQLQGSLTIAEKGKQSGIIGVALQGSDPERTAITLNEIGREYIRQNVERKAEEAEKSLAFLQKQLPEMKINLEDAEVKYNSLRNSRGTVDLGEEAKSVLQQSVQAQIKMVELRQKRDELLTRFQSSNPVVAAVNQQTRTLSAELDAINARIKRLPSVEQDVLRLTRDVKVNTDLYTSLLNSAQQLRLVKASKVGNARLLDTAVEARKPVRPNTGSVIALATLIGLALGVAGAAVRKSLFGGIDDPHEIEHRLGLTVSASVPHSQRQEALYLQVRSKARKVSVLTLDSPTDCAVEGLRSFRTALQFAMLGAGNNILMFSGPTPGVGKTFVSVNFAAVLAATGKKVLLIDGDLRKGYLHRYFGLERKRGLSEVIAGRLQPDEAIHINVVENMDFISTGELPARPSELLAHEYFSACIREFSSRYEFVVIDTAPVLVVSDALIIATHVGTRFNVVRGCISTLGEIEESEKRFRQAGHSVTGLIFNDLKPRLGRYYSYGARYGKYRYAEYQS